MERVWVVEVCGSTFLYKLNSNLNVYACTQLGVLVVPLITTKTYGTQCSNDISFSLLNVFLEIFTKVAPRKIDYYSPPISQN